VRLSHFSATVWTGHKNKSRAIAAEPRDAAVNFDTYRILQRHRAVSLPHHGFIV